jgi:3-oxoisoapionate decarboxylase
MEAGFSSYAVGWAVALRDAGRPPLDARGVVDLAIELGYPRVQLADNVPLHALTPEERAALHAHARAAAINVEVGTRGLRPETISAYAGIAAGFGSPFLRMVIDEAGYEPAPDTVLGLLCDAVPLLAQKRVILAIENHDRLAAAELARLLGAVDSPWVAICLDTANSLSTAEDIHTVLQALEPYVVNVHLKDVRVRRVPYLQGFAIEGVPLGEGQIPVERVVARLRQNRRCASATLEHWVPPEPREEATVRKERDWCTRSTATMRRLFPASFAGGSTPRPPPTSLNPRVPELPRP